MADALRRPLQASARSNAEMEGVNKPGVKGDAKCIRISHEERRKRAELDIRKGIERDSSVRQTTKTHTEHGSTHAHIPRKQAGSDNYSHLEAKLEDLMKRYQAKKAKYQTEVDALKARNTALEATVEKTETAPPSTDSQKALATAEANNMRLKRKLEAMGQDTVAEKREIERLKAENQILRDRTLERGLEVRIENLLECLRSASSAYFRLHHGTVTRREYNRLQAELAEERETSARMKQRLERSSFLQEEIRDLSERFRLSEHQRRAAERLVDELLAERQADRVDTVRRHLIPDMNMATDISMHAQQLLDLTMSHSTLAIAHLKHTIAVISDEHQETLSTLHSANTSLTSTEGELALLQLRNVYQESVHSALETSHAQCSGIINRLQADLSQSSTFADTTKRSLEATRLELRRVEDKARVDREALKRANDGAMRWKCAETALEEEIAMLRDAVDEARRYEDLYNDLLETHRLLESREVVAVEEAERVAAQNAELVGGVQRISYVETVRRETAVVKQELVSTRMMLNTANGRITELTNEVEAYKTIDGLSASTRMRVVRRQPEGSGVLRTSRSTGGLRSVSGPVRR